MCSLAREDTPSARVIAKIVDCLQICVLRGCVTVYANMNRSAVKKLILQRLSRQFRIALLLAFGSIVLVLVVNFFVLLVAYECWAFGKAIISRRVPHPVQVCTYDGRFHWH